MIVSSAEVAATKPDSDLIIAALQRLNLPAAKVRMVGDTCYDIEAATKVGVATIAFLCGGSSEQSLQGAAEIYQGPAEFLKALKG